MRLKARGVPAETLAVRLAVALKRLRARLREVAFVGVVEPPVAQLAILKRLRDTGATTAAALAQAEHVTHQAIAQNLIALKRAGLVRTTADPNDGRKNLVHVTAGGNRLFESVIASRDAWLSRAIEQTLVGGERAALERAVGLLERLADAEPTAASER